MKSLAAFKVNRKKKKKSETITLSASPSSNSPPSSLCGNLDIRMSNNKDNIKVSDLGPCGTPYLSSLSLIYIYIYKRLFVMLQSDVIT